MKYLSKKLGRNRSADEEIDCGDSMVPKPSWRNFSCAELSAATNDFSPACFHHIHYGQPWVMVITVMQQEFGPVMEDEAIWRMQWRH
ncbi:hypothetical protein Vadar_000538 [Vaccinium darrowii]|uniref:Uncharacterized protein n=1 Tax=Vaccinium darrowii TaxID=229202 RepID=A0ACB7Z0Y6_9ERIC|nr:hypothetical protein Vadar_000538 [Vaccinium darrowii]